MRGAVFTLILLFCLIPICSHADMKEIIAEGEYFMGEGETPEVAAERAKKNAIRKAAEQAGAFVRSYTKVHNMVLKDDVVEVIANHSMSITILAEEDTKAGKRTYRFYAKIKAVISEEDIAANLKQIQQDKSIVQIHAKLKTEYDQQTKEIDELKKKLVEATGDERKEVLVKIGSAEAVYKATLWYEQGQRHFLNVEQKIAAFTKAIELNPKFSAAYLARAKSCQSASGKHLGAKIRQMNDADKSEHRNKALQYLEKAKSDLDTVIEMNPELLEAYKTRASVYNSLSLTYSLLFMPSSTSIDDERAPWKKKLRTFDEWSAKWKAKNEYYARKAVEDYTQLIKINPDDPELYVTRAVYLGVCGEDKMAIEDISRAIDITNKDKKLSKTHRLIKLMRYHIERADYSKSYEEFMKVTTNTDIKNLKAADLKKVKAMGKELLQILGNKKGMKKWLDSQNRVEEESDWSELQFTISNLSSISAQLISEQQVIEKIDALAKKVFIEFIKEKYPDHKKDIQVEELKKNIFKEKIDDLNKKITLNPEDPINYIKRAQVAGFSDCELRGSPECRTQEETIADYSTAINLFTAKPEKHYYWDTFYLATAYAGRASMYSDGCRDRCVKAPEKASDDYIEAIKLIKNVLKTECASLGASDLKSCEKALEDVKKELEERKNNFEKKICAAVGMPDLEKCNNMTEADAEKKCNVDCQNIIIEEQKYFKEVREKLVIKPSIIKDGISHIKKWLPESAKLSEEVGRHRQAFEDYTELCNMGVGVFKPFEKYIEDPCKAAQRLK